MAPLEIVALDACPMGAAVGGAVGSSVKAGEVERVRMVGIDSQIVDVLRLREEGSPRLTAVVGCIDTAVVVGNFTLLSPCRQVKALGIARVDLQTSGTSDT